jgi:photosystem II stability/assembly factor-like uncharacterized protein/uncharacterized membrane protein
MGRQQRRQDPEDNDGGATWVTQRTFPGVYMRCVGFANADVGWIGTFSLSRRLLRTTDGGANWRSVSPLPPEAPVFVCGLSVVSDRVVFASGTNQPTDIAAMLKTTDGGETWTAWNMTAHATVLIDCFFRDPMHGFVVGGKSANPAPTTRDTLKPVVLETTDGGVTWTNRLAGQDGLFPFGEWGWKIQFLDDRVGFVSLENMTAAAILKTVDGGKSWTRIPVADQQGNVNLEGVGFIDERQGWVGGWGPGGFGSPGQPQGFSSATIDGGRTWRNANEIGLFINRFRFFGRPVEVGYASGDTVYKYSSDPIPPAQLAAAAALRSRALLPQAHIMRTIGNVSIPVDVPAGTKRISLLAWTRFGEEIGTIHDELRPPSGAQSIEWDGMDARGRPVAPGDYIIRAVADDETASSILTIAGDRAPASRARAASLAARAGRRRSAIPVARQSRFATLTALVRAPVHDMAWLHDALQTAIQLELATLPPYLTARWTIAQSTDPSARSIRVIRGEEMLHMGLACNMLVAIGGTPLLAHPDVAPKYPGELPWGIRPGLRVTLRKLDRAQAKVFMDIEYPQGGPISMAAARGTFVTIGEFYEAVLAAFHANAPALSLDRQLEGTSVDLFKVASLADVERAIRLINLQGEGSNASPEEAPDDLAHYYRFGEIANERRYVQDAAGKWGYNGPPVPPPVVHDMADVPPGGYQQADVPDPAVWDLITRFDRQYSDLLRTLQRAWTNGDAGELGASIGQMITLGLLGRELVTKPRPDGRGNYGPCFRFVP